jgi:hypothetical protein
MFSSAFSGSFLSSSLYSTGTEIPGQVTHLWGIVSSETHNDVAQIKYNSHLPRVSHPVKGLLRLAGQEIPAGGATACLLQRPGRIY